MITFSTPLSEIKGKGFGVAVLTRLAKFGMSTVKDLLWHFPSRYEDFSRVVPIAEVTVGVPVTISGVVTDIKMIRTWKRRMFIVEAKITDATGTMKAVWFNQRFLVTTLKKGTRVNLAGKVTQDKKRGMVMSHPSHEIVRAQTNADNTQTHAEIIPRGSASSPRMSASWRHTGRLVPVYPETRRLTSKMFRYLMKPLLESLGDIPDPLPESILAQHNFPGLRDGLSHIHFPASLDEAKRAKQRFIFEDLFLLQLTNLRQRLKLVAHKAHAFAIHRDYLQSLLAHVPFSLTGDQQRALEDVLADLSRPRPMNRLLQGDVGSGKTIVAALAALMAAHEGKQSAFMAPTEVLARQHYLTFIKFFTSFERGVALLTSSECRVFFGDGLETTFKKKELLQKVAAGNVMVLIGTHALLQKNVSFLDLGLIVIDEQHRFGVRQRAQLVGGGDSAVLPHFLSMSATPIPRTLTLTVFGDLDLSLINELPKGRKEVITKVVDPVNRDKAYAFIRGQVKKGRQVFVICPRIDKSQTNADNTQTDTDNFLRRSASSPRMSALWEVKAVKEEYEKLAKKVFPDLRVAMLHGKLKAKAKEHIMNEFRDGNTDVLVSTSVVEVGVDVPNATIMMIEGSDRFGLSQLYQFRGRVGRGEHQSFCFLFTDSPSATTKARMQSLVDAKNGFELAERDLELRGPGELLGKEQTGMPDLIMKALRNKTLIAATREAAAGLLREDPNVKQYPALRERLAQFAREIHLE